MRPWVADEFCGLFRPLIAGTVATGVDAAAAMIAIAPGCMIDHPSSQPFNWMQACDVS